MMPGSEWQWDMDHAYDRIPCSLCGDKVPAVQMRELWVLGPDVRLHPDVEIRPLSVTYVCPKCP